MNNFSADVLAATTGCFALVHNFIADVLALIGSCVADISCFFGAGFRPAHHRVRDMSTAMATMPVALRCTDVRILCVLSSRETSEIDRCGREQQNQRDQKKLSHGASPLERYRRFCFGDLQNRITASRSPAIRAK